MKRSEALARIKEYLDINSGMVNEHQILNLVEKIGMVPPMCERELDWEGREGKTPPGYRWNLESSPESIKRLQDTIDTQLKRADEALEKLKNE